MSNIIDTIRLNSSYLKENWRYKSMPVKRKARTESDSFSVYILVYLKVY